MCQLAPKLIYIYENKVFCTFLPNFILKINTTENAPTASLHHAVLNNRLQLIIFGRVVTCIVLEHELHVKATPMFGLIASLTLD